MAVSWIRADVAGSITKRATIHVTDGAASWCSNAQVPLMLAAVDFCRGYKAPAGFAGPLVFTSCGETLQVWIDPTTREMSEYHSSKETEDTSWQQVIFDKLKGAN